MLFGVAGRQPFADFMDEGARGISPRLQRIGDRPDRVIGVLQLFFINIGVVDPIDIKPAQGFIVGNFQRLIMLEAQRLKEIHVDDRGAGRHDRIDHAVFDHVAIDMHAAAGAGRAGQRQDHRAFLVRQHRVEDFGRPPRVARGERHFLHRIDDWTGVIGRDVDMFDRRGQQFGFAIGALVGFFRRLWLFGLGLWGRRHSGDGGGLNDRRFVEFLVFRHYLLRLRLRAGKLTTAPVSCGWLSGVAAYMEAQGASVTIASSVAPKPLNRVCIATP